jgi:hypothetical protein
MFCNLFSKDALSCEFGTHYHSCKGFIDLGIFKDEVIIVSHVIHLKINTIVIIS